MKEFDISLITELETEILNQYLSVFLWFHNFDEKVSQVNDEKKVILESEQALIAFIKKINYFYEQPKWQAKVKFTKKATKEIYADMVENCENPRYFQFSQEFQYSIKDLITILDKLSLLSYQIPMLNEIEKQQTYRKIFHEYVDLYTISYGIKNPLLKKKIDKARSRSGNFLQLAEQKKQLFINILLEGVNIQKKWQNPTDAVSKNLEKIEIKFKEFDEQWIRSEIEKNAAIIERLKVLNQEIRITSSQEFKNNQEIENLTSKNIKFTDALKKGYPFEDLINVLPYNTHHLKEILIRNLKDEKEVLQQIIDQSYFKTNTPNLSE